MRREGGPSGPERRRPCRGPRCYDAARSFLCLTSELQPDTLELAYRELERRVADTLVGEGHTPRDVELRRTIDVHYAGQSFELSLPIRVPIDKSVLLELDERFATE